MPTSLIVSSSTANPEGPGAQAAEKHSAEAARKHSAQAAERNGALATQKNGALATQKNGAQAARKHSALAAEKHSAQAAQKNGAQAAEMLSESLGDAMRCTRTLVEDLHPQDWIGPQAKVLNPPLWEVGHVASFYERFLLRQLEPQRDALLNGAEGLYDSFHRGHLERWNEELPDPERTLEYLEHTKQQALQLIETDALSAWETYLTRLCIHHQDMHNETMLYCRQTVGHAPPQWVTESMEETPEEIPPAGDVEIPGGLFWLGAHEETPFVYDNEKWSHPVRLKPFRIARSTVTNGTYAEFVADGGYACESLWTHTGVRWLREQDRRWPVHWRPLSGGGWEERRFDRWHPLRTHAPVAHVSWYEALAYCRWAQRRLPTEAEWECAASADPCAGEHVRPRDKYAYPWGDEPPAPTHANLSGQVGHLAPAGAFPAGDSPWGCRQMLGNLWEWTDSPFYPYPGYVVDYPYREYSAPWFGDHMVIRGGSWCSPARMLRNTLRNFYRPHRSDIFVGFRTCAL